MPRQLYGISKLASELITERYGDLFGLSTASVRPSSVYGTMDRVTASRNFMHVPNRIAHMAVGGAKRVRVNTIDAVGDYIHAEDVARAIVALLHAPRLRYSAYNIAAGDRDLGELVLGRRRKRRLSRGDRRPEQADIMQDPTLRDGMWGAYDISRITARDGLEAAPDARGLHAYMDWIAAKARTARNNDELPDEYPRDLVGYGGLRPMCAGRAARIAVSIVLNYEEGGEICVLHGDAHSESVLTDVGGDPLPNARNLNVESNFEYGSRVGFWEIMRILRERRR